MQEVIAVLEDDEGRTEAMKDQLQRLLPSVRTLFFDNAPDILVWLEGHLSSVLVLCLDHDLGPNRQRHGRTFDPGCGRDVADFLASRRAQFPILIHSANVDAAYGMAFALEDAGWSVERVTPFDDLVWIEATWTGRVAALAQRAQTQRTSELHPRRDRQ